MVKLAIVGYKEYNNYLEFKKTVDDYIEEIGKPELIVSGGARGVDKMAEKYAKEKKIAMQVFPPNWDKYGKSAGPKRNTQIIENSTHVIAFPSVNSVGTIDSINKAKKYNKILKIVNV